MLQTSTSPTNSPDATSNDLKNKNPYLEIPSVDTIFNYIKGNNTQFRTLF
ncbi:Mobile element protein [Methanosarcina sp. WH1]|nr:Mobile element protein [Methanosarcina sp. WH1]